MMHRSLYSLVVVALLFGTACSFTAKSPEYTEPEPATDDGAIAVTIRWSAAGGGDGNQDMTLDGSVIYWANHTAGAVGATDTATGKRLWYNNTIGSTVSNPIVGAKGVYLLRDGTYSGAPTTCVLVDKNTGTTITTIQLPSEGYDLRMFSWIRTDTALVWHAKKIGLVSLDEALIDTSLATQPLTPETLWPGLYESISVPLWYSNKLYFQLRKVNSYDSSKTEGDDIIVYEPATKKVLKRIITDYAVGTDSFPMTVYNTRIFYQDWNAVRGINPGDDTLVFSLPKDIDHGSGKGFGFYKDRLYFSNSDGADENHIFDKNLICRSTVDGHLIWHVNADQYSLGNRPVVKDGVLYILTQTGFKLFNANTGALLGCDTRLKASGGDFLDNTIDDGTYLYPRSRGRIYAIKMDWKLDANGKLTK